MGEIGILLVTLFAAALAAISQYFMKKHVHKFPFHIKGALSLLKNRGVLMAACLYLISAFVYLYALSSGELDFVYPIFASTFVFVLVISAFKLKERMGVKRILGILFVVLGILIIALTY